MRDLNVMRYKEEKVLFDLITAPLLSHVEPYFLFSTSFLNSILAKFQNFHSL